jgi:hypothetical protein
LAFAASGLNQGCLMDEPAAQLRRRQIADAAAPKNGMTFPLDNPLAIN